jgi:glycerol uptake facilitator-like aquaporin
MDFRRVHHGPVVAEFIGTFSLSLAVLASLWGAIPIVPTAVIAGFTLALFVMSVGEVSGAHLNPAVTIGLYSLKKVDAAHTVAYLIAQLGGALIAMVVMSMFLEGNLTAKVEAGTDYTAFFAEFLGALVFTFGITAAVHRRLKGVDAGLLIGGSLTLGIIFASLGGNGIINPAVATAISSLSWPYVLGPVLGAVIGMNAYAAAFGKKGRI